MELVLPFCCDGEDLNLKRCTGMRNLKATDSNHSIKRDRTDPWTHVDGVEIIYPKLRKGVEGASSADI